MKHIYLFLQDNYTEKEYRMIHHLGANKVDGDEHEVCTLTKNLFLYKELQNLGIEPKHFTDSFKLKRYLRKQKNSIYYGSTEAQKYLDIDMVLCDQNFEVCTKICPKSEVETDTGILIVSEQDKIVATKLFNQLEDIKVFEQPFKNKNYLNSKIVIGFSPTIMLCEALTLNIPILIPNKIDTGFLSQFQKDKINLFNIEDSVEILKKANRNYTEEERNEDSND